jgi:hypothetical protein
VVVRSYNLEQIMTTNTTRRSIVVGVFRDRGNAQQAIGDLKQAGFTDGQIGLVTRHPEGEPTVDAPSGANMAAGAGIGAAAGAGLGALWALGIATLGFPALGPVLVGGTLMAALAASIGSGAVVGTLLGALIGLGIPEEEAKYYEQEVHAGRTVVTVRADSRFEEAWQIMNRHGAYNIHSADAKVVVSEPPNVTAGAARAPKTMDMPEDQARAATQPADAGEVLVADDSAQRRAAQAPAGGKGRTAASKGKTTATSDVRRGEEIRVPVKDNNAGQPDKGPRAPKEGSTRGRNE